MKKLEHLAYQRAKIAEYKVYATPYASVFALSDKYPKLFGILRLLKLIRKADPAFVPLLKFQNYKIGAVIA